MTWDSWVATWRAHAGSPQYRGRLRSSIESARDAFASLPRRMIAGDPNECNWACALSGGKDSLALLGVLHLAGLHEVPCVHVTSPLNTPGMAEAAEAAAVRLGFDLEIVEPDVDPHSDVWAFLQSLPGSILDDKGAGLEMRKRIASGNCLIAWQYDARVDGFFSGVRADESRGRTMNRRVRGRLYQRGSDGGAICQPIVDWSGRDVWGLITELGLEHPPHYRLLWERFGISPESPMSRVDCVITSERVAARGAIAHVPVLYPELWRRLLDVRPELKGAR